MVSAAIEEALKGTGDALTTYPFASLVARLLLDYTTVLPPYSPVCGYPLPPILRRHPASFGRRAALGHPGWHRDLPAYPRSLASNAWAPILGVAYSWGRNRLDGGRVFDVVEVAGVDARDSGPF